MSADWIPEPSKRVTGTKTLFLDYLDYFRSEVNRKVDGLSAEQLRSVRLPSGWSALELLKHLVFMEQRWLRWGFIAEDVEAPWGDWDADHTHWQVGPGETAEQLLTELDEGGRRTREIVEGSSLTDVGASGGRFLVGDEHRYPPQLEWILFHVLHEYARHVGHLDIVRELTDGSVGGE